jgi:hypothetical protein
MAAFASFAAAEARAYAKVKDKTWVNAHAARRKDGTIVVRVQRFMNVAGGFGAASKTFDGMNKAGAYDELTDDGAV